MLFSIDKGHNYGDLELLAELARREARESFWAYRQYIADRRFKIGWWQRQVAGHMQYFKDQLLSGTRPVMIFEAPPQHGKSFQVIEFLSWLAGHAPDLRTIYTSFSDRLGVRANLRLQRIFDSEKYKLLFDTRIGGKNIVTISGQKQRNQEILEYLNSDIGSFRNTTVNGAITGEGLDLGVIDDPVKGREAANSEAIKTKTWEWFVNDFFTRFSEEAGILAILTRWAVDDVIGRYIDELKDSNGGVLPGNVIHLRYPAIAEHDEEFRKAGEALFPEHKSLEFLQIRKRIMPPHYWESLYQQNPIIPGGNMFPESKWNIIDQMPLRSLIGKTVRYWDKAGTHGAGAYTSGVRMHELKSGGFIVSDVAHGQWHAFDRETQIEMLAESDAQQFGTDYEIWVEQEPGSSGLESAQRTVARLAGYRAYKDKVTGDKFIRAEPWSSQVLAGNAYLLRAKWNRGYIEEHSYFPNGPYKDRVDASSGAFMKVKPEANKGGMLW